MILLAPSMLSADFTCLGEQIKQLEQANIQWLHVDVMDGAFVPSISFGMPVIRSIRKCSRLFFDVHLMVEEPGRYIEDFKNSGADLISVHVEACTHLHRTLQSIKKAGLKAGVVLNPATPLSSIEWVLNDVDMVLLMCVNPGFGGQSYIPQSTDKIRDLKTMIDKKGLTIDIEVDGGIKSDNVKEVLSAGANIIVAGSGVFNGNMAANIKAFEKVFGEFI